ncbi:unnamed protein product [Cylindrotheca closterium]|uniref:Uncharacterized protein n=1 Tax=Cylindrotheca closterium TaxID=2856 RepID=A0AAD2G961_9STRA|nr:unnamed protein product [Cylindrotheca closterium]
MDHQAVTTRTRHIHFNDAAAEHEAVYTFDDDDIEIMFYTNVEVNSILKECQKEDELPSFWAPLRIRRTELLWDQVDKEQHYQWNKMTKKETYPKTGTAKKQQRQHLPAEDSLARVSLKISQYQQAMAIQEAKKLEKEVQEIMMESTSDKNLERELLASSIHKNLSQKDPVGISPTRLQTLRRNSIAARPA